MCPYVTAGIQNPRAQNGLVSPSLSHPQKLKPLHSHTAPAMSAAAKAKASGGGRRGGAKDPTDALRSDKKRRDMDDSDDAELDRCLASSAPPPPLASPSPSSPGSPHYVRIELEARVSWLLSRLPRFCLNFAPDFCAINRFSAYAFRDS